MKSMNVLWAVIIHADRGRDPSSEGELWADHIRVPVEILERMESCSLLQELSGAEAGNSQHTF